MHAHHERIPLGLAPMWLAVTRRDERYIHVFTPQTGHLVYLAHGVQLTDKDRALAAHGWRRKGHWFEHDGWTLVHVARAEHFGPLEDVREAS